MTAGGGDGSVAIVGMGEIEQEGPPQLLRGVTESTLPGSVHVDDPALLVEIELDAVLGDAEAG